jgi:hypothetical protein
LRESLMDPVSSCGKTPVKKQASHGCSRYMVMVY